MDIVKLINNFNNSTDEKLNNTILTSFRDNYKAFLENIQLVQEERKIAQALNIISRKKNVSDYILTQNNIITLLEALTLSKDNKVRKNIYSVWQNLGKDFDFFKRCLDREDNNINIYHLFEIMTKLTDFDKDVLNGKLKSIDKNDIYYKKLEDLISKTQYNTKGNLTLSKLNNDDNLLLTSSNKKILKSDFIKNNIKILNEMQNGIIISAKEKLANIFNIRSFDEVLIAPNGKFAVEFDAKSISKHLNSILNQDYFNYIFQTNQDKFSFRLEIKGLDEKSRIKITKCILTNLKCDNFINIRDNYNFEIRVYVQNNTVNVFIKVPVKDNRFSYRINELPASISPVTASIISSIIGKYVSKPKIVLDGFVGTGTMLLEYYKRYGDAQYIGVDIEAKAIAMARENIGNILPNFKLIKHDITTLTIDNKADLILSNLPFGTRVLKHDAILKLYDDLCMNLKNLLNVNGIACLLTTNGKALRNSLTQHGYEIISEHRIESGGLIPYLIIAK